MATTLQIVSEGCLHTAEGLPARSTAGGRDLTEIGDGGGACPSVISRHVAGARCTTAAAAPASRCTEPCGTLGEASSTQGAGGAAAGGGGRQGKDDCRALAPLTICPASGGPLGAPAVPTRGTAHPASVGKTKAAAWPCLGSGAGAGSQPARPCSSSGIAADSGRRFVPMAPSAVASPSPFRPAAVASMSPLPQTEPVRLDLIAARKLSMRTKGMFTPGHPSETYVFGQSLGTGFFSTVLEAVHTRTLERVAVKVINRVSGGCRNTRQECILLNEIDVLHRISALNNPNLPRLVAAYEEDHRWYIVMNLCSGHELYDRIVKQGHFSEEEAATVTRKLVAALKALHDNGVIHRDLKPENILYESDAPDAEVVISDFGLATCDGVDWQACKVGSPAYVAPEVLEKQLYSPAGDVWSMGVILYVLLSGVAPFYGNTDEETFDMILHEGACFPTKHWSHVSADAKALVRRMLERDPKKRITTAEILAHPWLTQKQKKQQVSSQMVDRLRRSRIRRKFRSAVLSVILGLRASKQRHAEMNSITTLLRDAAFDVKEMSRLRTAFYSIAPSGQVTRAEFRKVMRSLRFGHLPLDRLFAVFDKNHTSTVDYKEFLVGFASLRSTAHNREAALRLIFQVYDVDNDGRISRSELARVLRTMVSRRRSTSRDMSEAEFLRLMNRVFKSFGSDETASVDFDQFKRGLKAHPVLLEAFAEPARHVMTPRTTSTLSSLPLVRHSVGSRLLDTAGLMLKPLRVRQVRLANMPLSPGKRTPGFTWEGIQLWSPRSPQRTRSLSAATEAQRGRNPWGPARCRARSIDSTQLFPPAGADGDVDMTDDPPGAGAGAGAGRAVASASSTGSGTATATALPLPRATRVATGPRGLAQVAAAHLLERARARRATAAKSAALASARARHQPEMGPPSPTRALSAPLGTGRGRGRGQVRGHGRGGVAGRGRKRPRPAPMALQSSALADVAMEVGEGAGCGSGVAATTSESTAAASSAGAVPDGGVDKEGVDIDVARATSRARTAE